MTHRGIFRGDEPDLIENVIISGSGDDNFRQMIVVQPFVDPPNSFRAQTVNDLTFIVPERTEFSTLEFDVGLDPKIDPIIFSIQNRCLNTTLRVKLTLPQFLRSNLGNEFLIPAIGDSDTAPIIYFDRESTVGPAIGESDVADLTERLKNRLGEDVSSDLFSFFTVPDLLPLPTGAGTGLINVTLTFSEAQAKTLNPDVYNEKIIFDIFPNDVLTGPIFVSTTIGKPRNLNLVPDQDFPIDDNEPIITGSVDPPLLVITESIEVEKLVPTPVIAFNPGADGVTDDGFEFTAGEGPITGPPPAGWTTEADGRAYPPIIPDPVCDPATGTAADGTPLEDIPENELTPLQKLLLSAKDVPPTFGSITKRRGFVIEPRPFLDGDTTNIATTIRLSPNVVVADSIPGRADFRIIRRSGHVTDGFTAQINKELDIVIAAVKEGNTVGSPLGGAEPLRLFIESVRLSKIIENGERFNIGTSTKTAEQLQIARVIAPAASILFTLQNEGAGAQVEPIVVPPITVDPPVTVIPPDQSLPVVTWRDCSGTNEIVRNGTPPNDWIRQADGCYIPPTTNVFFDPAEPTEFDESEGDFNFSGEGGLRGAAGDFGDIE